MVPLRDAQPPTVAWIDGRHLPEEQCRPQAVLHVAPQADQLADCLRRYSSRSCARRNHCTHSDDAMRLTAHVATIQTHSALTRTIVVRAVILRSGARCCCGRTTHHQAQAMPPPALLHRPGSPSLSLVARQYVQRLRRPKIGARVALCDDCRGEAVGNHLLVCSDQRR